MGGTSGEGAFPHLGDESREIWDTNAEWWDDRIGDGNDFQTILIEPATEELLALREGETVLDVACGAGRFARRMAELGAKVVAFDFSENFVRRAEERTKGTGLSIQYAVLDARDEDALLTLGEERFDAAVCTMALMDMAEIETLFRGLSLVLKPEGRFVFSVAHPCFHPAGIRKFSEMYEESAGRHVRINGVKVLSYLTPVARKTEGIIGQPEPQYYFHRPVEGLLRAGFDAGFVIDGLKEPAFGKGGGGGAGLGWDDMPEIPPVLVVRLRHGNRQ